MPAVACLIADPSRQPLDGKLVDEAARAVDGKVRWLAEAEAAEVATDLSRELVAAGAPGIHLYTLNRSGPVRAIWDNLGD